MPRNIDADLILTEMESKLDMQELYLPIHFQKFIVDKIPSADVAPVRHGRWEELYEEGCYSCSVCGNSWIIIEGTPKDNEMYFCPNCGAKMDEKEDT